MKFSELFSIKRSNADDWFDPVLSLDTKLFIDPFLIYQNEFGYFNGSHKAVITFFNDVFKLIARSNGDSTSYLWKRAENLLIFPEAEEFCFGYTSVGTRGAGSGKGFSRIIAADLWEAVKSGVQEINHFEEVGIIGEGIGADRISDITATILRHKFAAYTLDVCKCHNVPVAIRKYKRFKYIGELQWTSGGYELPLNPYNGKPIILCPEKFVRELPTINASEFWDFYFYNDNEILRQEFGDDITRNVDKKTIVSFARKYPKKLNEYIRSLEETNSDPYDVKRDPRGLLRWYDASLSFSLTNPFKIVVDSKDEFLNAIGELMQIYKKYIEDNAGWRLLWNDDGSPRREEASQLLLLGIVKHYCKANDIDISREANIGRGSVDFKVSKGYSLRVLIEVKLAKNTKFWNGLQKQLPKYLEAEDVELGFYLVIVQAEKDLRKISAIREILSNTEKKSNKKISIVVVDARTNPASASKL
jgi:hypothetical protein